jgi:hypothetical protein
MLKFRIFVESKSYGLDSGFIATGFGLKTHPARERREAEKPKSLFQLRSSGFA